MEILHRDEALLVVNKPAGLSVLPDGWQPDSKHLVKLLEAEYGRVWIVHRLDKITSGIIVVARSAAAHRSLSMQFERHTAQKVYQAICVGKPEWEEREAHHPLRSNVGHKHRTSVDARTGKPSSTRFRVIMRFRAHAYIEACPLTGRTHQIRAHAAALRIPLLGDTLYGAPPTELIMRPALHALSLSFMHPTSQHRIMVTAPLPKDFKKALRDLKAGAA